MPRQRRRRIRKLRLLALLGVLGLLSSLAFTLGAISAVASEIPALDPARQQQRELNGYVYANDGKRILAVLRGDENRVLVSYDEISPWMKHAIVAVEDRRFWDHDGIDLRGIARALWADVRQQQIVEGGSTITQQFVKVNYGSEKSFARKVREAALAWQLEREWRKERILAEYLNTIYFANQAYGVQQAAKIYFGKGASKLELHEAALLAGIPANPSAFDPIRHPGAARKRREHVLRAMLDEGTISQADFRRAVDAPLPTEVHIPGVRGPAPYFTDFVLQELLESERFGARAVYGGGLRVTTTIDLGLQQLAQKALWSVLDDPKGPSASLVALDPSTGDVLAMVGGRNYRESQFNLAVQSQRQPGSAFKPFVLAAALEQGISPATTMESKRITIPLGDRLWVVNNYEHSYLGSIDVRDATAHSDNAVYAQLTQLVTPRAVARTAQRLGVRPLNAYFSIGLGAQAVTPLELARAYAAFANGGYRIDSKTFGNRPRVIARVTEADGDAIVENDWLSQQVLEPRTAAHVNALLRDVIERGTGTRARLEGWPAAGKTGTTENYGDAWFVGYTPELVVAVWVGYPDRLRPMETEFGGEPVSGGSYPALIWKAFMEEALPYIEAEPADFAPPPSDWAAPQLVVQRDGRVELDNGLCRNRVEIVYFSGFGPKAKADCKENEVEVPDVTGKRLEVAEARLEAQPLTPVVVYTWAQPGQPIGVVLEQSPSDGTLSSYDDVTLVLGRARHGTVPKLTGLPLGEARERLRRAKLRPRVARFVDGPPGTVVAQEPKNGVAAAPGMPVELVVARG